MTKYYDLTLETKQPDPVRFKTAPNKAAIIIQPPNLEQSDEIAALPAGSPINEVTKILLGDKRDELLAHFENRAAQWMEFGMKLRAHFFGAGADDAEGGSLDSSDS